MCAEERLCYSAEANRPIYYGYQGTQENTNPRTYNDRPYSFSSELGQKQKSSWWSALSQNTTTTIKGHNGSSYIVNRTSNRILNHRYRKEHLMSRGAVLRAVGVFVVAMAAGLSQALPGLPSLEDLYTAFLSSVILTGGWLGVGYTTPLEPSMGK